MTDAVAKASGIPATVVRRAIMLGGRLDAVARIALTEGRAGLEAVGLEVGRPVQPMLASTAASVTEAVADARRGRRWSGSSTASASRSTAPATTCRSTPATSTRSPTGCPRWSTLVRSLPGRLVRARRRGAGGRPGDGPAGGVPGHGQRDPRRATTPQPSGAVPPAVLLRPASTSTAVDLIDEPLVERRRRAGRGSPARGASPARSPPTPPPARPCWPTRSAAGHEGVVVKGVGVALRGRPAGQGVAQGQAGAHARPGGAGGRVGPRPAHRLAVEPPPRRPVDGRARRRDGFVMVGKTFKGLTDELLRWQTERFLALPSARSRGPGRRPAWCGSGPSRWWRSPSTACSAPPATPAAWPCASPGSCATATTSRPADADPITTVQAMLHRYVPAADAAPGRQAA